MKRFTFALERVRQWREEQVVVEQLQLERLQAERGTIEGAIAKLERDKSASEATVLGGRLVDSLDLQSLDQFRRHTQILQAKLRAERAGCDDRIAAQRLRLIDAQRNARLLDKVKARKLKVWQAGFEKEIEEQAAESHLARWQHH